jgi:replicative DNA helicase
MVCFIYRPEYYNIEADDTMGDGCEYRDNLAKYRGGAPGTTIGLHWDVVNKVRRSCGHE